MSTLMNPPKRRPAGGNRQMAKPSVAKSMSAAQELPAFIPTKKRTARTVKGSDQRSEVGDRSPRRVRPGKFVLRFADLQAKSRGTGRRFDHHRFSDRADFCVELRNHTGGSQAR